VLAKAATVLDRATGGRFLLGLGAGWFEGDHLPFGIPLPPIGERIDRLISAVDVLHALFSAEAAGPPGVTRPDRFYPLAGATNLPPPVRVGGPPIVLGGQKRRGIELAARAGDGWVLPGINEGDASYLREKREELFRAMDRIGRDPSGFLVIGQVQVTGRESARRAVEAAKAFARAGATDLVIAVPSGRGPEVLPWAAREVAEPIREAVA
jgi:alkanesulfonate monooxygenase SsuD/methylene tetrahydromethanopterin reductase-like flavin-dependent oxidoreductase (luciferase family)